ncbi:hypothetical protein BHM03_00026997 [Ensete ventricosum]|nr:hypothetical protein BHM03_00026997 [Ensete ventricosum]
MSCSSASLLVAPLLLPHHPKKLSLPRRRSRAAITSSLRLGVEDLAELAHNKVLVSAAISGAVGQLSKPLTSAIRTGKGIDLWAAVSAGGMPSTHSAAVAAAATSLGLERGFSDSIFGMSVVFAFLVMYDAQVNQCHFSMLFGLVSAIILQFFCFILLPSILFYVSSFMVEECNSCFM